MQEERHGIELGLNYLNNADKQLETAVNTILDICHRARDIFKSSETQRKHKIIKMLFPSLLMDRKKLVFSIREPFNSIVKSRKNVVWLPVVNKFRTFANEISKTMGIVLPFEKEMLLVA